MGKETVYETDGLLCMMYYLDKKPSNVDKTSLAPSDLGIVMNMKTMATRRKYVSPFTSWMGTIW